MASILNVDQINNAAGTSAVTIDASSGKPSFPNGATLPAGSVVQVVNTTFNTQATTTSGTASATGLSQSITPQFANSKLLVQMDVNGVYSTVTGGAVHMYLYRDGGLVNLFAQSHAYNTAGSSITTGAYSKLIDAGSTSATTFQLYFAMAGSGTAYINVNNASSSIILMEIAQ